MFGERRSACTFYLALFIVHLVLKDNRDTNGYVFCAPRQDGLGSLPKTKKISSLQQQTSCSPNVFVVEKWCVLPVAAVEQNQQKSLHSLMTTT